MNVYDIRIKAPYSITLSGVSGSGKTTWTLNFLKHHHVLVTRTPKHLIWLYGVAQPELFDEIKRHFSGSCEFISGFPENFYSYVEKRKEECIICIDDLMQDIANSGELSKLFTRGRSHLGCSIILLMQNIFPKGGETRTISLNTQYQALFKNPRDSLQVSILARQLLPSKSRYFIEAYRNATSRPFGYLFCDFTQETPDEVRYRTNIFPHERPIIVYEL